MDNENSEGVTEPERSGYTMASIDERRTRVDRDEIGLHVMEALCRSNDGFGVWAITSERAEESSSGETGGRVVVGESQPSLRETKARGRARLREDRDEEREGSVDVDRAVALPDCRRSVSKDRFGVRAVLEGR